MSTTRDRCHINRVIAGFAAFGATLALAVLPVRAAEPEIIKDGLRYVPILLLYRDGQEVARYTLDNLAKLEHDLKATR